MNDLTPLYGHTSPDSGFVVDDYPYGFRLRCQIRYWLESHPRRGFRFVSQTTNPKRPGTVWNAPKKSTYASMAACMYLDAEGHVQWSALTEYADAAEVARFVTNFPAADLTRLRPYVALKVRYLHLRSEGKALFKINNVPQPLSETEIERAREDLAAWQAIPLT